MSNGIAGPTRVVIADDHALVREGTRRLLAQDPDIEVIGEAADGLRAVELVDELHPDVLIVDVAMPELNGVEVTRRVKASRPEVAVLALTVHDEAPYVVALLEAGAAGYLLKDVEAKELIAAVHTVHRGGSILHAAVTRAVLDRFVQGEPPADDQAHPLTGREMEVLRLAARGFSNKQIAGALELSPRTVQTHLANLFGKLGVTSRTEAVIEGLRRGWLALEELS
jgi:two-component system, NarL family, response regulator LiaR